MNTRILFLLIFICTLTACKKKDSTNTTPTTAAPLIKATGWETVTSIPFSDPNGLNGGMQAEDLLIKGDSIGILYGEVYDIFRGLASGGSREYRAMLTLGNKTPAITTAFPNPGIRQWINKPDYNENMVFVNNTFSPHLFMTYNASTQTQPNRLAYAECNEAGTDIVPVYSLYNECYQKQNLSRTPDGSVLFIKANPDLVNSGAPLFMNYYEVPTHTWLSSTLPYENGMNELSLYTTPNAPLITGSQGFATGNGNYRAMFVDAIGGITVVRPNTTNHQFDTLAYTQEPSLNGMTDTKMVGGAVYNNTFYGLLYSDSKKMLYEYTWTEGSNTITKLLGDVPLTTMQPPMFPTGNWKYFEIKPDGTPYTLMPTSNTDYDVVLYTVKSSGMHEVGRLKQAEYGSAFISLPRYSNGYYYVTAWIPVLAGGEHAPQLDVIRIKE